MPFRARKKPPIGCRSAGHTLAVSVAPRYQRNCLASAIMFCSNRCCALFVHKIFVPPYFVPRLPGSAMYCCLLVRATTRRLVRRRCFTFFETVEDGRVHSCFKKRSRLAKRNNCAFPGGSLISASLNLKYVTTARGPCPVLRRVFLGFRDGRAIFYPGLWLLLP